MIHIREAAPDDLPAVLAVQREAFGRVSEEFGIDPAALDPLRESLADLEARASYGTRFLISLDEDGVVTGTVRGTLEDDRTVAVNRLCVATAAVRLGVGTALMRALEDSFAGDARRFALFTGDGATGPLELYRKLGYTQSSREAREQYTLVHLTKQVTTAG